MFHKIAVLLQNIFNIYGHCYSNEYCIYRFIRSIIFLPVYIVLVLILITHTIYMWTLYLPFSIAKVILGDNNIHQDPIFSFIALPIGIAYFGSYIVLYIPYLLIAFLCDLIAEIISKKNHTNDYVICYPLVIVVPHNYTY